MQSTTPRAELTKPAPTAARACRGTAAALLLIGLAAALPILIGHGNADAAVNRCAAPEEITALAAPLPRVAARLRDGGTFTIVALGSSSTQGAGASRPENSYPSRLAAVLAARFPKLAIRVVNRGIGGEEAAEMEQRITREVLPEKPDLVIWQVGTNGVLHDNDPLAVMAVVRHGIERIKAAGVDVMLMNLQYAPAVLQHGEYHEMLHVLAAVAHLEEVPMFRRFSMMRQWVEDGRMPLRMMLSRDRLHMTDVSYDCLAREVSASLINAGDAAPIVAGETPPKA